METHLTLEVLKVVTGASTFATAAFTGMLLMAPKTEAGHDPVACHHYRSPYVDSPLSPCKGHLQFLNP